MKREIKFRAWDIQKAQMLYDNNGYFIRESGTRFQITTDGKCNAVYLEESVIVKPILMQFTGLQDKNGKDIYEGDIARTKHQDKARVIWHNEFACFCYETIDNEVKGDYQFTFKKEEIEIIGNIYENENLLTN